MDKDYEKKEPTPNPSIDQEEKVEDKVEVGSDVGSKLVDTSVVKSEEPQTKQPTLPPTQEPKSESLPHVGDEVGDEEEKRKADEAAKRKAYLDQIKAEHKAYKEKQNRPNLAKDLYKQKREALYEGEVIDEWSDAEVEAIKSIFPEISEYQYNRSNEELTQEIQDLLDNPNEILQGNTKLGRNVRNRLVDKTMQQSYGNLGWCNDFLNELSTLRRLYATATYSENPEVRKRAIKRINQIEETTNIRLNNMTDDDKTRLKNYMLLTEYAQTYENIKNYPDSQDIWILAREADQPIVAVKPMEGAYKTTIGDFKSDMYRLATNRGSVSLPSGITKTRRKPNDVNLYSVDFDAFFNPNRYIELSSEKQKQLAKEGLSRYFDMTKPDYTQITDAMNQNTRVLVRAILDRKEWMKNASEAEKAKYMKEIEELEQELEDQENKTTKAQNDLISEKNAREKAEGDLAETEEKHRQEQEARETKEQAREAVVFSPKSVKSVTKDRLAREKQAVSQLIHEVENITSGVSAAEKADMIAKLNQYRKNLEMLQAVGGNVDNPNIVADSIQDIITTTTKNPVFKRVREGIRVLEIVNDLYTAYELGKKWKSQFDNAEGTYSLIHDKDKFNEYFSEAFRDYPKAQTYYLENMDKADFGGLWEVQLREQLPVFDGKTNMTNILNRLRKSETDLVHGLAQGYGGGAFRKDRTLPNSKYRTSKKEVAKILGLSKFPDLSVEEVQLLDQDPWLIVFLKGMSPEVESETRLKNLKKLRSNKDYQELFSQYIYE